MKKLMATLLFLSTPALAQDLQADRSGLYVGGTVGTTVNNERKLDFGIRTGYQVNQFLRAEASWQNSYDRKAANTLLASGILQYRLPSTAITPYAHLGTGVALQNGSSSAIYSAGAGARLAVAKNMELDGRYSYTGAFDRATYYPQSGYHSFTLGVNYRF